MSTAYSPQRHATPLHWLRSWVAPVSEVRPTIADRASEPDSPQTQAANIALMQAESPTERIHAIYQAQAAGVPLHEIEQQLDWAEYRG